VLYLHGGGHVAGSAFGYRHLAGAIATAARVPALVIDYRLAPEHPYPAAVQDAVNAYLWLRDSGDQGKIVVAGDSSAGGLVMSVLLALRERDLPVPAGAALLCPWVDLTGRTQRPPQDSSLVFSPDMAHPVPTHDFHIFWSFLPEARNAIDEIGRFVRTVTSTPGESAARQPG